jgi:hypothetical protein
VVSASVQDITEDGRLDRTPDTRQCDHRQLSVQRSDVPRSVGSEARRGQR